MENMNQTCKGHHDLVSDPISDPTAINKGQESYENSAPEPHNWGHDSFTSWERLRSRRMSRIMIYESPLPRMFRARVQITATLSPNDFDYLKNIYKIFERSNLIPSDFFMLAGGPSRR